MAPASKFANALRVLGTEPEPGFYEFRRCKGAPRQALRIVCNDGAWAVLLAGEVVRGSGASDPLEISLLAHRWPFTPITESAYYELLRATDEAGPQHPLSDADNPVDLRRARPLY